MHSIRIHEIKGLQRCDIMGLLSRFKKKDKSEKEYAQEFIDFLNNGGNVIDGFDIIKRWVNDYPGDANVYYANTIVAAQVLDNEEIKQILKTPNGEEINLDFVCEIFADGESRKPGWAEGSGFLKEQALLQIMAKKMQEEGQ